MDNTRIQAYLNDPEGPNPLVFASFPRSFPSSSPQQILNYTATDSSVRIRTSHRTGRSGLSGSDSKPSNCFDTHRDSSAGAAPSTAPSTVSSLDGPLPLHAIPLNRINYPYDLVCECLFVGCGISFYAEDVELWIAHSISHFGTAGPPMRSLCTICDSVQFEGADPHTSWRRRMLHINAHFVAGASPLNVRPDFWVVKHLWNIGLMTAADLDAAVAYSERPKCKDLVLVAINFQTEEMKRKAERDSLRPFDLNKERRQMLRERRIPTARFG